jgi:hypothetical protein
LIGFVLFQKEKITTNEEDPQIEMGEMEIDEQYKFAEDQDDSSQGQNG